MASEDVTDVENLCARVTSLEKKVSDIRIRLGKLIVHKERKINEKFRMHDRAVRLSDEFDSLLYKAQGCGIGDAIFKEGKENSIEELKTIVKSLVKLVDSALEL
jgi:archaellum component FlaC